VEGHGEGFECEYADGEANRHNTDFGEDFGYGRSCALGGVELTRVDAACTFGSCWVIVLVMICISISIGIGMCRGSTTVTSLFVVRRVMIGMSTAWCTITFGRRLRVGGR